MSRAPSSGTTDARTWWHRWPPATYSSARAAKTAAMGGRAGRPKSSGPIWTSSDSIQAGFRLLAAHGRGVGQQQLQTPPGTSSWSSAAQPSSSHIFATDDVRQPTLCQYGQAARAPRLFAKRMTKSVSAGGACAEQRGSHVAGQRANTVSVLATEGIGSTRLISKLVQA